MTLADLRPYTKDLTLLLVEDDETVRSTLLNILKRIFKNVDEAEDGQHGLEMYTEDPTRYDMIFTDISMPRMDGVGMIKAIRKNDSIVPIIVLSAHNESDRLISMINAGADSFIQKPFTTDIPLEMVYRLAVRVGDSKILESYTLQLEEQNSRLAQQQKELIAYDRNFKIQIWEENQIAVDTLIEYHNTEQPKRIEIDYTDYHEQLLSEDIHELADLIDEIENYVLLTFQGTIIHEGYIDQLANSFQKFGSILYRYPMFNILSQALFGLSTGVKDQRDIFVHKQEFVLPFLENLIFVLHKYVDDVWKNIAKNPHFYDASMANDIQTFMNILSGSEEYISNTDDLLEFF